jgi:hypothetical protein
MKGASLFSFKLGGLRETSTATPRGVAVFVSVVFQTNYLSGRTVDERELPVDTLHAPPLDMAAGDYSEALAVRCRCLQQSDHVLLVGLLLPPLGQVRDCFDGVCQRFARDVPIAAGDAFGLPPWVAFANGHFSVPLGCPAGDFLPRTPAGLFPPVC